MVQVLGIVPLEVLLLLAAWTNLLTGKVNPAKARSSTGLREFCNREVFNATCGDDEVIIIEEARYGRMSLGRCVLRDLGYLGCSVDVSALLAARCSGRQTCQVSVADDALYQTHPCPKDTTSHMMASYSCHTVTTDKEHHCQKTGVIEVKTPSGYLATRITEDYGYGSSTCPWMLRVADGQQLNITLINFGRNLAELGDPSVCYELAIIVDGKARRNVMTCGTDGREKTIYISRSNAVEIRFVDPSILKTLGAFLLKYEVSRSSVAAVGCPAVRPVGVGWVQRSGDQAIITCNFTEQTFTLRCQQTRWVGHLGNCSQVPSWRIDSLFGADESFPYGILIVVAIGVALGVFLGGLLLSVAIFYLKRRNNPSSAPAECGEDLHDHRSALRDCKDGSEEGSDTFHWGTYGTHTLPGHPPDAIRETRVRDPGTPTKTTHVHQHTDPYSTGRVLPPGVTNTYRPRHIYESPGQFS